TCCGPAPCWKTPKNCARWYTIPVQLPPTTNPRKRWILCATAPRPMPRHGNPRRKRCGMQPIPTKGSDSGVEDVPPGVLEQQPVQLVDQGFFFGVGAQGLLDQ